MAPLQIVDVRVNDRHHDAVSENNIPLQILEGLAQPVGQKTLPTMLLYDERGLKLYDDITTHAPEYYLFAAEEEILKNHADEIVSVMHSHDSEDSVRDEIILELGAGALRKTSHILRALARSVSVPATPAPIKYYALDLEERELKRCLTDMANSDLGPLLEGKVDTMGMWGTYDDGLKFLKEGGLRGRDTSTLSTASESYKLEGKQNRDTSPNSINSVPSDSTSHSSRTALSTPDAAQPPLHIMFLGSSLGNFDRRGGTDFLRSLPLRAGAGDTLLIGLDHDNDPAKIETAYDDEKGYTKKFIMNGLTGAGRALGDDHLFDEEKWDYVGRYNVQERYHEAYYKSRCAHTIADPSSQTEISFVADELVKVEVSYKYSEVDVHTLFTNANLRPIQRWTDSASQYSLWLLERPPFMFPLLSSPSASTDSVIRPLKRGYSSSPFGVPSVQDWQNLWTLWSFITLRMIPPSMLFQKPIDLRHICLFYLGHIPTFLDIHLSRLLDEPNTEPENFKYIFERGIDPNVDDPTQCHPHSEVPQADDEWPGLVSILDFQSRVRDRVLKLYSDIDSNKRPLTRKMGRVLFMTYEHEALHAETLLYMLLQRAGSGTLPPSGFTPPPWESLSSKWDAFPELATESVTLGPATVSLGHDDFEANDEDPEKALDVDGHAFGWDNESPRRDVHVAEFRIDWRPVTNGQFYEFYKGEGKDKVQLPASWVETPEGMQVRTPYGPVPLKIAYKWPIMTSYNNLSTYAMVKGGRIPTEPELRLFLDKFESGYEGGANVGFRNWHPIPATTGGGSDGGRGHNGGVWEWTSTVFDDYEGFEPSKLYPGYSADFFDKTHQTVLGGSYATIPRITERRSVRNWYQKNYPYPWIGARVAYDIPQ
ncbi:hypothetical protein PLICRDRAFT_177435 [Plicaturopsis crispa FD-325 SS-3]|nr:hypothetical protein PLICRDRAFT_177435 [Plicaturopsis crispa FD-325 SS-3]